MWPSNVVASACAALRAQSKSSRGKRARRRLLHIESMEPRLPLSATALMLTDTFSDMEETSADADAQVLVAADPVDAVTPGTLSTSSDMTCQPLSPDEVPSIEAQSDELIDILAEDAVLKMGPVPSQTDDDGGQESAEFTSLTLLGGPAPLAPDSSVEAEPAVVDAPFMLWFQSRYVSGNYWAFEGEVDYEFPSMLSIQFGGYLKGAKDVKVGSGGEFKLLIELPPDAFGEIATAQAFTPEGVGSNTVWTKILG